VGARTVVEPVALSQVGCWDADPDSKPELAHTGIAVDSRSCMSALEQ
jgi:hypothetical protein